MTSGQIPFTPRAKKVLELSLREALSLGSTYIGSEHILLGLVRENDGVAALILLDQGADAESIRERTLDLLGKEPGGLAPPEGEHAPVELTAPPLAQEVLDELERLKRELPRLVEAREFDEAALMRRRLRRLRHAAERLVRAWQRHRSDPT